jgi:pimeloyl-ACP methyl ester carboxylesterase
MHVAIVLPGASYGPEMPGLAIPIEVLRERGAEVSVVAYPDRRDEIGDVVAPQVATAVADATQVTVVAKSLGTSVFSEVRGVFPDTARAIWITPLFGDPDVRRAAIASSFPCLSVFAHDDSMHDPEGQAAVTAACNGVEVAFDDAGHGLTMSDEQRAQLRAAVEAFVA